MIMQIIGSCQDDDRERQEFCHDEDVTDQSAGAHAAIVHDQKNAEQKRDYAKARQRAGDLRPEFSQIHYEEIGVRRASGETAEHQHPSHLQVKRPNAARQ